MQVRHDHFQLICWYIFINNIHGYKSKSKSVPNYYWFNNLTELEHPTDEQMDSSGDEQHPIAAEDTEYAMNGQLPQAAEEVEHAMDRQLSEEE